MSTKEIKALIARLEEIENEFDEADYDSEDFDNLEDEVLEIEEELGSFSYDDNYALMSKAEKIIAKIKRDNDFYDSEENLDMMFPDRDDEDFDEDLMSYDSVFGDD